MGVLFEDYIDEHLFSTRTVLIGLVVGALLMIAADLWRPKRPKAETVDQITYGQAFSVGLIQCLSLWPGFSRSGSTISGGVLLGMSHRAAADFTFIMAVPIMAKHKRNIAAQKLGIFHGRHAAVFCRRVHQLLYRRADRHPVFPEAHQPDQTRAVCGIPDRACRNHLSYVINRYVMKPSSRVL